MLLALLFASPAIGAQAPAPLAADHGPAIATARPSPQKQWLLWKQNSSGSIYYDVTSINDKDGLVTVWWGVQLSVARELPSGGSLISYKEQIAYKCPTLERQVLEKTGYDGAYWSGAVVLDQKSNAAPTRTERKTDYGRFGIDLCSGKLKSKAANPHQLLTK